MGECYISLCYLLSTFFIKYKIIGFLILLIPVSQIIIQIFNQFLTLRVNNHMYTTGDGAAYTYSGAASEIDASKLNYEIDYIRLYQKNDGKSQINLK